MSNVYPIDFQLYEEPLNAEGRSTTESLEELWEDELRNSIVHVCRLTSRHNVLDIVDDELARIMRGKQ